MQTDRQTCRQTYRQTLAQLVWAPFKLTSCMLDLMFVVNTIETGVQWLSGRMVDSRPRGCLTGITALCP